MKQKIVTAQTVVDNGGFPHHSRLGDGEKEKLVNIVQELLNKTLETNLAPREFSGGATFPKYKNISIPAYIFGDKNEKEKRPVRYVFINKFQFRYPVFRVEFE